MSDRIQWLWRESKRWVARGLISEDQAGQIRGLYPAPKAALPWGTIIFAGFGAVTAGLGIILLLAYNWQAIPRGGKLAIVFAGLMMLHGVGIWLFQRGERWRQAGEAVCLLGSMLFGSGIWLIAQIYNIQEHYPNGFLIWGLGALLLAWAMPSLVQGLLAVTVLGIWGCSESWAFEAPVDGGLLLILAGVGLLAWRLRSPFLFFFVLAAFVITLCANVSVLHGFLLLRVLLRFGTVFLAVALLSERHGWFAEAAGIWKFYGWWCFLLPVYLLSFPFFAERDIAGDLSDEAGLRLRQLVYGWGAFILSMLAWGWVEWSLRTGSARRGDDTSDLSGAGGARVRQAVFPLENWLLPLTALLSQVLSLARLSNYRWEVAAVYNLIFLALAVAWIGRGCREGLLRPTLLGSLLLVALVAARYFDLFENLAVRGVVFLVVGGLLIGEGIAFRRARQRLQPAKATP